MNRKAAQNSKILVITYVFPPAAWVGAHRTLKYCKYLGGHGWTPIVLTAKPIGVTFLDENLSRQLPADVVVHRTFDIDPAKWEDKLTERKLRRARRTAPSIPDGHEAADTQRVAETAGILGRLKRLIKGILKDSPDSHVFWVPFAFLRGVAILLRENVELIYSTSPPHSTHLAAYLLAKCFRKPYVLDFRDPWYVSGSARGPTDKIPALLKVETRVKRAIVRRAAKVICVSRGERDELRAEFPEVDAEHFTYITNGFDSADITESGAVGDQSSRLSLVHAGTIYSGIGGEFFGGLRRLLETDPVAARSMEVQLVGDTAGEYAGSIRMLESAGIVKVHGMQPHARTLQMIQACDVPVILMGGTKYLPSHLPSKLFEYLHAGKPVLAIAGEGEATEILRLSGLGIVVRPHSVDSVAEALRNLVAEHAAGRLKRAPNHAYIRTFERAALTEKLARVLDAVKETELARQQCPSR